MARRKRSEIPKGLPEKLHGLFLRGDRYRFNGFWLDESDKDRVIASWLDQQKDNDVDLGDVVKSYLYELATGHREVTPYEARLEALLDQLTDMIKRGVFVRAGNEPMEAESDVDDLLAKLTGFGT